MAQASSSSATTLNFRNRKANINKLSNTNYRVWSSKMIILFRQTKLWSVVQGIEAKPDVRDPKFEAWEEKDLAAQLEIMSHLDDQQADTIRKFETSHEMWTDLRNEFEPKTDGNQVMTLNILVTLKMKDDDEMAEFINTWKRKLDDCLTAGVDINQKLQRLLLLGALPNSWSNFVTTQNANHNINLNDLINNIRQEDAMRKVRQPDASQNTSAMIAYKTRQTFHRPRPDYNSRFIGRTQPKQGGMRFSNLICHQCHKPGHTREECNNNRNFRNKPSQYRYKPKVQAHIVEDYQEGEENKDCSNDYDEGYDDEEEGYNDLIQSFFAEAFNVGIQTSTQENNTWYFDTGATHHLTNNKDWLSNYTPLATSVKVRFGNNGTKEALGKGEISFKIAKDKQFKIGNVYFVPGITKNLLSVGQATESGATIEFKRNYAQIKYTLPNGEQIKYNCNRSDGGLYPIEYIPTQQKMEAHSAKCESNIEQTILWHHRLGHLNVQAIKTLQLNNMVSGLPKECFSKFEFCEGCLLGKMPQHPFPIRHSKCQNPLQLVYSDICGPFPTKSITGSHYFISFVDDYTRFTVITFLKTKDQALQAFKNYTRLAEKEYNTKIHSTTTDGWWT